MRLVSILIVCCFCWPIPVWAAEDPDYFPLQVGNWWEYEWEYQDWEQAPRGRALLRTEVGSVIQIGGQEYLQLLHPFGWAVGDTLWVRTEGRQVWSFVPEHSEFLWLDFGLREEGPYSISAQALGRVHPRDVAPWKWKVMIEQITMGPLDSVRVRPGGSYLDRPHFQELFPGQLGWADQFRGLEFDTIITDAPVWTEFYVAGVGPVLMHHWSGIEGPSGMMVLRRAQVGSKTLDFSTAVTPHSWGEAKSLWLKR